MNLRSAIITFCLAITCGLTVAQEAPKPPPVEIVPNQNPVVDIIQNPILDYPKEPSFCDYLNGGLGTTDFDGDGVNNCEDNCVFDRNKNQKDKNKNGVGDVCEWRERAREEWESVGERQRRTATEPVDLESLVRKSTTVLLVRFTDSTREREGTLDTYLQAQVVREIKGRARRIPISVYRGIWVFIPDKGPDELGGDFDLLVFLKNGKVRRWERPHTWSAEMVNGKPYTETHYFRYELADPKYGVLGVSAERLKELEDIVQRQKKR